MDREAFYKEQYDKSISFNAEINSSLATQIGILTALSAALYFCTTNFNYDDPPWLCDLFIGIDFVAVAMLVAAIFSLGWVFGDFFSGRNYLTLNDPDTLDQYYDDLVAFYTSHPPASPATVEDQAQKDFDEYFLAELIRNTSHNRQTNRVKGGLLFRSNRYMIYALFLLILLMVPFGIDFGRNRGKDKVAKVKIDQSFPVDLTIRYHKDTTIRLILKPIAHGKANSKH